MPAAAQVPAPRVEDVTELQGLSARWTAALETLEVPGFAVAVVKDGAVLALDAFGVRNAAGEPATPDTCYYIASATKPFTAMAVCMLAGEGKLELDASLKGVLPELVLPSEDLTVALTLRDLLCHRHVLECGPIVHRDAYTGQITDEIYFRLLQDAEIANYVRYSNIHFTLAGRAIEAASGLKWQDFLDQRLFEPAGMIRTTAYASEMYGTFEHAEPMLRIDGEWRRSPLVKTDRTMHAAGGMGTTARDAARWLILNLNGGEIDGRRILPETMQEEYYSKNSDLPVPQGSIRIEDGFALGWCVGKYRDPTRPYFFHGGGYIGAASYICFLPEHGIGVAALANSDGGAAMATIVTTDVLDRLLGVTGQPEPVAELRGIDEAAARAGAVRSRGGRESRPRARRPLPTPRDVRGNLLRSDPGRARDLPRRARRSRGPCGRPFLRSRLGGNRRVHSDRRPGNGRARRPVRGLLQRNGRSRQSRRRRERDAFRAYRDESALNPAMPERGSAEHRRATGLNAYRR